MSGHLITLAREKSLVVAITWDQRTNHAASLITPLLISLGSPPPISHHQPASQPGKSWVE